MATITSNGTGGGLWSATATWNGGAVPVDDDTVVIASGDTVTYNVDWSSAVTYPNGLNGLTITGTLKVSTSTSSYMKMKAATVIVGAGTFNIGEAGAGNNIPFAVKFTLTGGAGWYIDGNAGLTMTVYGEEPSIKYIKLSGAEAAGQTELSVDTNVTGDIWAAGDTIRINDVNGYDSEERVIAAGGIASGAITVTSGLTNAKIVNALVVLVTRNVRIIPVGTADNTIYRVSNLTVASGEFSGINKIMFRNCTMNFSGGVINYCSNALYTVNLTQSGGITTGCTSSDGAYRYVYFVSSTGGVISGCNTAIREAYGQVGNLLISGCASGLHSAAEYSSQYVAPLSVNGTVFDGCGIAVDQSAAAIYFNNITITNCGTGFYYTQFFKIFGGTFTNNTYHFRSAIGVGYGITLTGGTEVYRNDNPDQWRQLETFEIYNYGGNEGAYKSWTRGGIVTSQTSVMPSGYSIAYLFALAAVTSCICFMRVNVHVPASESINIEVQLRKNASMAYLPRVYLMNIGASPLSGTTPVDSFTMTDSTDTWEKDTFTIDNSAGTTDKDYTLWFVGKNASGNMYSAYDITTAGGTGGGLLTNPGMNGGMRG